MSQPVPVKKWLVLYVERDEDEPRRVIVVRRGVALTRDFQAALDQYARLKKDDDATLLIRRTCEDYKASVWTDPDPGLLHDACLHRVLLASEYPFEARKLKEAESVFIEVRPEGARLGVAVDPILSHYGERCLKSYPLDFYLLSNPSPYPPRVSARPRSGKKGKSDVDQAETE